jgi:hypothetical protein
MKTAKRRGEALLRGGVNECARVTAIGEGTSLLTMCLTNKWSNGPS